MRASGAQPKATDVEQGWIGSSPAPTSSRHPGIRPPEPAPRRAPENPRWAGRFFARLTGRSHGRRCSEQLHNPAVRQGSSLTHSAGVGASRRERPDQYTSHFSLQISTQDRTHADTKAHTKGHTPRHQRKTNLSAVLTTNHACSTPMNEQKLGTRVRPTTRGDERLARGTVTIVLLARAGADPAGLRRLGR